MKSPEISNIEIISRSHAVVQTTGFRGNFSELIHVMTDSQRKAADKKNRQCNVEKTWSGFLVSGPTKQKGLGNRLQDWQ